VGAEQRTFHAPGKIRIKAKPGFLAAMELAARVAKRNESSKNENGTVHMEAQNIPAFQVEDYMPRRPR